MHGIAKALLLARFGALAFLYRVFLAGLLSLLAIILRTM